jgi:hypothetical protein
MRLECITMGSSYQETEQIPSYTGLQEFYVDVLATQIIGGSANVRVIAGARHPAGIEWLYSVVMPGALLDRMSQQCAEVGRQATSAVTRRVTRMSDFEN